MWGTIRNVTHYVKEENYSVPSPDETDSQSKGGVSKSSLYCCCSDDPLTPATTNRSSSGSRGLGRGRLTHGIGARGRHRLAALGLRVFRSSGTGWGLRWAITPGGTVGVIAGGETQKEARDGGIMLRT